MKHKLNPLQQFTLFLSVYALFATFFQLDFSLGFSANQWIMWHLIATLGFGFGLFYVFTRFFKKKKSIWNTVATCLIIFLVLHPGTSMAALLYPLVATLIAITYKFFFEYKGKPIINPVVFSLLVLASITALLPSLENPFVSWWGASFEEPLALVLLVAWIFTGLRTWRKLPLLISFLLLRLSQ